MKWWMSKDQKCENDLFWIMYKYDRWSFILSSWRSSLRLHLLYLSRLMSRTKKHDSLDKQNRIISLECGFYSNKRAYREMSLTITKHKYLLYSFIWEVFVLLDAISELMYIFFNYFNYPYIRITKNSVFYATIQSMKGLSLERFS